MVDIGTNTEVRRRFGVREKVSDRVDWKVYKSFGHVQRMSGGRLTKKVYEGEVESRLDKGRQCTRCSHGFINAWELEVTGAERFKGEVHGYRKF